MYSTKKDVKCMSSGQKILREALNVLVTGFFLKCVDLMSSLPASLFSRLQVSATLVPMPSVKLSNCALSFKVGERILCIRSCSQFLLNKTKQA